MYQPHITQDIRRGLQRRLEALARNIQNEMSAEDLVQVGITARTLAGNINSLQDALPEEIWQVLRATADSLMNAIDSHATQLDHVADENDHLHTYHFHILFFIFHQKCV